MHRPLQISYFTLCAVALLGGLHNASATESGKNGFTYQGRIFDAFNVPVNGTVDVTFDILSPNGCVLYREKQSGISLQSPYGDGYFALQVGSATGATKRIAGDPGRTMTAIFTNDLQSWTSAWNGVSLKDSAGDPCTYTPSQGDSRALRVKVYNPGTGGSTVLSPDLLLTGGSTAVTSETLQGITPSGFLQPNTDKNLSQITLEKLTDSQDASTLHNHDTLHAKLSGSATLAINPGSYLNLGHHASDPAGLTAVDAGKVWYNASTNTINYFDGTSIHPLGAAVAVTSFNGRTGVVSLTQADVHAALGAASGTNHGYLTSADWTAFNNAASDTSAATSANTASTLVKRDANGNFSAGTISAAHLALADSAFLKLSLHGSAPSTAGWGAAETGRSWIEGGAINYWDGSAVKSLAQINGSGQLAAGDGSALTNLNASNISTGTLSPSLLPNSGVSANTYTKVTVDAKGLVTAGSSITSGDVTAALGFTPLNKAGDTMTGPLTAGTISATSLSLADSQFLKLSFHGSSPTTAGWGAPETGRAWIESGTIKYWDGGTTKVVGIANDGVISVVAGTGLAGGTISSSGTLSLATITANRAMISGASGYPTASAVTNTELGYLSGVTSAIQTQFAGKEPSVGTGTTAQYYRGDKSWQSFDAAARASLSQGTGIVYNSGTGVMAVDVGTTANKIVQLDGTGKLPALNGSVLTSLNASNIATGTLSTALLPNSVTANTYSKVTVNAKGLVTAGSSIASGDVTTALGFTPVNKAGDTMTGALTLSGAPTVALHAATKSYVDTAAMCPGPSSCPAGMTLIGTSGDRESYCIDSNETAATNQAAAFRACKAAGKHLCSRSEWLSACGVAGVNTMTNNAEWVADVVPNSALNALVFGNGSCTTVAASALSTSNAYRCCKQ